MGLPPWDDGNQEKTARFLQCYITLCNLVGKTPRLPIHIQYREVEGL